MAIICFIMHWNSHSLCGDIVLVILCLYSRCHLHTSWLSSLGYDTGFASPSLPYFPSVGCFQLMGRVSRKWKHGRGDGEKCEYFYLLPPALGSCDCPSVTLRFQCLLRNPSVPPVPTGLQSFCPHCLFRTRASSTALVRSLKINYTSINRSFVKMSPNSWVYTLFPTRK